MIIPTNSPLRAALLIGVAAGALGASPRIAAAATIDSLTVASATRRCSSADNMRVMLQPACDSAARIAPKTDSTSALHPITTIPRTVHRKAPIVFFAGLAGGLAANARIKLDQDPGGYTDSWRTSSMFPDKGVHGLAAFALTSVGVDLGVKPWTSAMTICAAGVAFEYTQGYVSRYDIGADCIGASGAALWRSLRGSRNGGSR
jgi:hypothetical protein